MAWHLPYRELPDRDGPTPPHDSAWRFIGWSARQQAGLLSANAFFGVTWMVSQALVWSCVGEAIDRGVVAHDSHALVAWVLIVFALGLIQAVSTSLRHQLAVTNWMNAAFRAVHLIGRHVATAGTTINEQIASGDINQTVGADAMRVGGTFDSLARFIGSLVSWVVVSAILLATSLPLGLIVLVGVPLLASLTTPLMKPLHATQAAQREAAGQLSAQAADTVAGLRILRGVGGEDVFLANYVARNIQVRDAGITIATPQAALESGQILLPAILTVLITFLGARMVRAHTLSAGQLVAFFGYSTFLTTPLRTVIEYIVSATRAFVGAGRVLRILRITPEITSPLHPVDWPPALEHLSDERSGVRINCPSMVALVAADPSSLAEVVDRLGRFSVDVEGVRVNDIPLANFDLATLRRHIIVSEVEPRLFSGPLREELVTRFDRSDDEIMAALHVASATDILELLEDGLADDVEERGRRFSGGQRQRISLARALLVASDVLIVMEPTSAVDSHTEQRIASRLADARRGRTTVIVTSSPLLLETVDDVLFLDNAKVVARGPHRTLLRENPDYARVVLRTDLS